MKSGILYLLLFLCIGTAICQENKKKIIAKIEVKGERAIHLNDKKVTLEELKHGLVQHYKKNQAMSDLSIMANGKTRMDIIGDIKKVCKEVLLVLRNELAQEKFKTSFDNLSEAKQEEIDKVYPLKITQPGIFDGK